MNMDAFQLFFNYLEERPYNNSHQNVKQDANYLEATMKENELSVQYQQLNLSDEQHKVITQWMPSKHRNLLIQQLSSVWACSCVFLY